MNSSLKGLSGREADFMASIEIYPCGPTTRQNPPFNGIRWNFIFQSDVEEFGLSAAMRQMIFPEFIDRDGTVIPDKVPLLGTLSARMHIIAVAEDKLPILSGTKFYCAEGIKICAEGVVTDVKPD